MAAIRSSSTLTGQAARKLLAQAHDALSTYRGGAESGVLQAAEIACDLLRAVDAGFYRLARCEAGGGWELEYTAFHHQLRSVGSLQPATLKLLRSEPTKVVPYDPGRPDPKQRNRFVRPMRIYAGSYSNLEFARYAGTHNDQLRALVCEGSQLLGWFGAFRRTPFTHHDCMLMNELIPSLCQRLALERRLEHVTLTESALALVLERIAGAVLVLDRQARPLFANQTARALLEAGRAIWLARLREAIERHRLGLSSPEFSVTPVVFRGAARCFLVVHSDERQEAAKRLSWRAANWQLTPQQSRVVALLARGNSNKAIAQALACSPRTVEHHVAAAMVKAGVETRAELVAKFWRDA